MIRDVNDPLYSFSGHIHHAKNSYRPLSLLVLCNMDISQSTLLGRQVATNREALLYLQSCFYRKLLSSHMNSHIS